MTAPVAYLDLETTGLDADAHDIWEIGLIVDEVEYCWMLGVDLMAADPMALAVGRFHERHWQGNLADRAETSRLGLNERSIRPTSPGLDEYTRSGVALTIARLTHGRHLVGAIVSFDEERVRRFMLAEGVRPSWHYHQVDVEALAVGYLRGSPSCLDDTITLPWKSENLSRAVGVDPADFERHTALGDCRWARAIYQAVMGS